MIINWLFKKLGIPILVSEVEQLQRRVTKLEKTTRLGKRSMRYDEIERARKRRYKKAA